MDERREMHTCPLVTSVLGIKYLPSVAGENLNEARQFTCLVDTAYSRVRPRGNGRSRIGYQNRKRRCGP